MFNKEMTMKTIQIEGITYQVQRAKPFQFEGKYRVELQLKRPNGKVNYVATVYENGAISKVVSLGCWA